MGTGCKPVGVILRRFESSPAHQYNGEPSRARRCASGTLQVMGRISNRWIMWSAIAALALCLLVGLVIPMDRLDGKGWPTRAIGYPLSAIVLPGWWRLFGKRRGAPFPHLATALFVTPFVLDLVGNLFRLFDEVQNFDDALHFVNWAFLVAGVVVLLWPWRLDTWVLVWLGTGFGAIAIVLWEFVEYVVQETGTTGLNLTYEDTISDLMLSSAGGVLGALVIVAAKRGRA